MFSQIFYIMADDPETGVIDAFKKSVSLMKNKSYREEMFLCDFQSLKNINQEIYKRFIKPIYFPILTLICCFLLTFSKVENNFSIKTIKVFLYMFLILVLSEISMRYLESSKLLFILVMLLPVITYFLVYNFLIAKVRYD